MSSSSMPSARMPALVGRYNRRMRRSTISATVLLCASLGCEQSPARSASADAAAPLAGTAAVPAAPAISAGNFSGAIAETMDSGGYTYVRLRGGPENLWVAAPQFDAKVGETITVSLDMPMQNFQSRTLN